MSRAVTENPWYQIQPLLVTQFGQKAYESWLTFLSFEEEMAGRVYMSVPSRFLRDWITTRYSEPLLRLWKKHLPHVHSLEIVVKGVLPEILMAEKNEQQGEIEEVVAKGRAEEISLLDERYTFDTFVVGKPNELAYAAAKRLTSSQDVHFNPLFLHGGVGLGKTHLMHAIAWEITQTQPKRKVLYMSAEQFMYRFVNALRHKDIMSFREQFRSVDLLMIDDMQFISGKESTQEEFFHTFNALMDKKKQIVLSADKSPSELDRLADRVRSRLGWGLVVDIHPTTYELRLGILESKRERLGVPVDAQVLEFLAHKITSNVRELEGGLNRIVAYATLARQEITLDLAQEVLKDLLRANDRVLTIEDIQKRVAERYNVLLSDMHSARRLRSVARPRQIAMYLCKKLTSKSLPEIGRNFGGRDHTTVMHAVRTVESLMKTDKSFMEDVMMLEKIIKK